ncbi:hypothetical protein EsVE80_15880 [Enterococcus saigonensis]|uniref:Uncharacterized protein n=1 Tax=Enterococcus saigonensis TaxID=1805431 RepID=A0A679IKI8_9ENTE|nr:hypothetical protein [Enterococcus saigonensis]BCA86065.1 hypothetical protein EsVE80_15880 [Enterococcus saigonensis]
MAQMTIATQLFLPLPIKEADLEKKVMWVRVKNHVIGDEKMTGVRWWI